VIIGEVLAPLMIILGFHTRTGALLIVANMLVALILVHSHQLMLLSSNGGLHLELQLFFLMSAVAVFFLGSGRYTLRN
jgi:putative oxidoreductase